MTEWAVAIRRWSARRSRREIALFCFMLMLACGYLDYVTGIEISLSVIYVIPIAIGAWYVGQAYGYVLGAMSAALWVVGDIADGLSVSNNLIPAWNGFIRLLFYGVLVFVLCRLRDLTRELGRRVQERAAALTREIAERERLEHELTEVSERERSRIGQDLHDSLCQHLTGTALVSQVLAEKLAARGLPEARESRKVVDLVEEGITLARGMAHGLQPVEPQPDGLMQALDEFAGAASERYRTACRFICDSPVLVASPAVATHLYRIAQEAVSNAARHGRATDIAIVLEVYDRGLRLAIEDNGSGIPQRRPSGGLGLKIMADRAKVIGGTLTVRSGISGGTEVCCTVMQEGAGHD
jgi:signal transduction histidine kinase